MMQPGADSARGHSTLRPAPAPPGHRISGTSASRRQTPHPALGAAASSDLALAEPTQQPRAAVRARTTSPPWTRHASG